MRFLNLRSFLLCLSLLLTVGCGDAWDLGALATALQHQYPDSPVSVSLTDGLILTVTVTDSALAVASCENQSARAMRFAMAVRDSYEGFDGLQTISIAFASHRAGVRTTTSATALPFRFARTLLAAGLTPTDSTRAVESCKAWRELQ